MGIIKKQTVQSTILLYAGTLLGFVTTGVLAPHLLSPSEIGTLKLLMSYSGILAGIGILGFSTVTIRFLPEFQKKSINNRFGFLSISMIAGAVGFFVTWLIITIIKSDVIANNYEKSPEFAEYFFLIIPLTLFQIYYNLFDFYNSALYRSAYGVFLRDFIHRILLLIGLLLVMLHYFDFRIYIYYYTTAICFPTILMIFHLIWYKGFDLTINRPLLNKSLLGSMASVAFFGLINNASHAAILQIDSIMVNLYLDSNAVGIYTITFYFGSLVIIPAKAFNRISPTVISNAFTDNDLTKIKDIHEKGCRFLFLTGLVTVLGLFVNLENIFYLIPRSYETGKMVIVYIALANLVKMADGSNDSIITFSKYYKLTTVFLLLLVVLIVVFNLILIPRYGMNGAAIAALISVIIHNITKTIFIWRKFDFFPYNIQYYLAFALTALIYAIVAIIPPFSNFILEIAKDSLLAGFLFLSVIWRIPMAFEIKKVILETQQAFMKYFEKKSK
ncbi:MAG: polysaccharide biosynthesis C-terminal domain-containing protein [Cyclobacteriaceae bacterium]|nr:polysaccharide biosynthesis C-terminal domain-containing protein [Cyclobacteriaceae bacterium]